MSEDHRIATVDGTLIDPFTVTAADGKFKINTIAHALAHLPRYGGHTSRFYSVAEHCLLVERLVEQKVGDAHSQRWALMHDAEEAYLIDMPAPIKQRPEMAFYRDAGQRLMREIAHWVGLVGEQPRSVKEVDVAIRATERYCLFPGNPASGTTETYTGLACGTMSPEGAKAAFLARFYDLFPAHGDRVPL